MTPCSSKELTRTECLPNPQIDLGYPGRAQKWCHDVTDSCLLLEVQRTVDNIFSRETEELQSLSRSPLIALPAPCILKWERMHPCWTSEWLGCENPSPSACLGLQMQSWLTMKIGISVSFLCECVTLNEVGCTTFRRKPSFKGTARNSGTSDRRHLQLQLTGSGPQMVINYNCFLFGALSVSCSGLHHLRIKPNSASLMRYHYLRIKASKGQHVITMYSDHGVWAQVLECSQNLQGWWPCGPNLNSELLPNMK